MRFSVSSKEAVKNGKVNGVRSNMRTGQFT